jgi:hypothetical protein
MILDRRLGDHQPSRDLAVPATPRQQRSDLSLARRESHGRRRGTSGRERKRRIAAVNLDAEAADAGRELNQRAP